MPLISNGWPDTSCRSSAGLRLHPLPSAPSSACPSATHRINIFMRHWITSLFVDAKFNFFARSAHPVATFFVFFQPRIFRPISRYQLYRATARVTGTKRSLYGGVHLDARRYAALASALADRQCRRFRRCHQNGQRSRLRPSRDGIPNLLLRDMAIYPVHDLLSVRQIGAVPNADPVVFKRSICVNHAHFHPGGYASRAWRDRPPVKQPRAIAPFVRIRYVVDTLPRCASSNLK